MALRTVANEGEGVIFEVVLDLVREGVKEWTSQHSPTASHVASPRVLEQLAVYLSIARSLSLTENSFLRSGEVNCLDSPNLLLSWTGQGSSGKSGGSWSDREG